MAIGQCQRATDADDYEMVKERQELHVYIQYVEFYVRVLRVRVHLDHTLCCLPH